MRRNSYVEWYIHPPNRKKKKNQLYSPYRRPPSKLDGLTRFFFEPFGFFYSSIQRRGKRELFGFGRATKSIRRASNRFVIMSENPCWDALINFLLARMFPTIFWLHGIISGQLLRENFSLNVAFEIVFIPSRKKKKKLITEWNRRHDRFATENGRHEKLSRNWRSVSFVPSNSTYYILFERKKNKNKERNFLE